MTKQWTVAADAEAVVGAVPGKRGPKEEAPEVEDSFGAPVDTGT